MKESDLVGSKDARKFAEMVEKSGRDKFAALKKMVSEEQMQANLELKRKLLVQPFEKSS